MNLSPARLLILAGLVLVVIGLLLAAAPRIPWLGRLPGDFTFRGRGWTLVVPLGTSLVASLVLSLLVWLLRRGR
jgi:hypothetical protein